VSSTQLLTKVKLNLEQAMKVQRWSIVIALLFFNLGSILHRVGGQRHAPAALPRVRDTEPIVQEAG
jgi:hypothetical protein